MTRRISRAFAWTTIAAILILSLVPPGLRPITGAPHKVEHFAIFALCGFAVGLGYRVAGVLEGLTLVLFAGGVELLQHMVPGRHARLSDFVVDAVASCVGVMISRLRTDNVRDRLCARINSDLRSQRAPGK